MTQLMLRGMQTQKGSETPGIGYTVKPALRLTSEQRPPVNKDQPESPTQLKLLQKYALTFDQRPPFEQRPLFGGPKGCRLYSGLSVPNEMLFLRTQNQILIY
jgi:hypothetical protein